MAAQELKIPVSYEVTKRELYTLVAREFSQKELFFLLWVESPDRRITLLQIIYSRPTKNFPRIRKSLDTTIDMVNDMVLAFWF
jgi:hypothetical protein